MSGIATPCVLERAATTTPFSSSDDSHRIGICQNEV